MTTTIRSIRRARTAAACIVAAGMLASCSSDDGATARDAEVSAVTTQSSGTASPPLDTTVVTEIASTPTVAPVVETGVSVTAAPVATDATTDTTTTTGPAPTTPQSVAPDASEVSTIPLDENGALACDEEAIRAAIGDPDFVQFDAVGCENNWAGAGYLNGENLYTPVILKAEGEQWVLQDWLTVCDEYPDMSESARLYCPGG